MKRIFPHDPTIGVDLGACAIRAAQTDRSGAVVAFAEILRNDPAAPHGPEDFLALRGVLYRQGFRGNGLFASLPKKHLSRTTLDLPPKDSGAPILEIARSELARQMKTPAEAFEFAWWDAPQPPRHNAATRAITVGCAHEAAIALGEAAHAAGLRINGLFSPSTAIAAALPTPPHAQTIAAIDLGWTDATLILVGHEDIIFERQLASCGLAARVAGTAKSRGIDPARLRRAINAADTADAAVRETIDRYTAELAPEIRSSIDYLRGCGTHALPAEVVLTGGGAAIPGIDATLTETAGIRVSIHPQLRGPAFAAANGLAALRSRCEIREAA